MLTLRSLAISTISLFFSVNIHAIGVAEIIAMDEGDFVDYPIVFSPSDWLPVSSDPDAEQICLDLFDIDNATWKIEFGVVGLSGGQQEGGSGNPAAHFGLEGQADLAIFADGVINGDGEGQYGWWYCSDASNPPAAFTLQDFYQIQAWQDQLLEGTESAWVEVVLFDVDQQYDFYYTRIDVFDQTVSTGPPVIESFFLDDSVIFAPGGTFLNWETSGADYCEPSGGTFGWQNSSIQVPDGSQLVEVDAIGTYVFGLTCFNSGGSDYAETTLSAVDPGPDLAVTNVQFSATEIQPGETIVIDATIRNVGEGTAEPAQVLYLVSDNQFISETDEVIATSMTPSLNPLDVWRNEESGPGPLLEGTYWVGVCVEVSAEDVDPNNNCASGGQFTVEGNVTCETGALSCGQSVSGNLDAGACLLGPRGPEHYSEPYVLAGSVGDSVWIDANWSFDGYLVLQGPSGFTVAQNDNNTNSSNSRIEYTFTRNGAHTIWATSFAPQVGGDFNIFVDCDGPSGPDLTVDAPSTSASNVLPGSPIQLGARLRNIGEDPADSSTLRWFLSSDNIITPSDPQLAQQLTESLRAGRNRSVARNTVAPNTPGTYYIGACVDAVSDESTSSNNCSAGVQLRVQPDPLCQVTQLSCGASSGGTLTASDCTDGPRGNGFFSEEFTINATVGTSLAIDAQWDGFDGYLYLVGPNGDIVLENDNIADPQDKFSSYIEVIIPQSGEYSIWPTTLARGRTGEFDLDVSCGSATAPDLVTVARLVGDPVVNVGDEITVEYEIFNVGNSPSNPTQLAMCQSPNPVISLRDTGVRIENVELISPGSSITRQMTITAPDEPGNFYFGPCVFAVEGESLVDNNCAEPEAQSQIEVQVGGQARPLMEVGGGALAMVSNGNNCGSTSLSCGQNIQGTLGAGDCDQGPRGAGFLTEPYVLSASAGDILTVEASWSDVDGYLYLARPNGTVVAESDNFEGPGSSRFEVEVPSSGNYRIWPTTFAQGAEGGYQLSVDCNDPDAPDFVVDTPTLSSTMLRPGQNVTVSAVARNVGNGRSDSTRVRYILSQTPQLTDDAIELGSSDVDSLAAGASASRSKSVRMPSTAGNYYMGVCADFDVQELETDNNCSMSGRFTVEAIDDPIDINVGLNDAWFNPATSGQGFFINVFPNSNQLFLAWFTYDTVRPPGNVNANLGDPGHRWRTAFGTFDQGVAELDIELTRGGVFDDVPPIPTQSMDGTIELRFSDCNNGSLTYSIPSINRSGVIPIERIAFDNAQECEDLINAVPVASSRVTKDAGKQQTQAGGPPDERVLNENIPTSLGINPALNDAWFNPDTSGQGFFVNVFPDSSQLFLAWFTYDTSRPPGGTPANLAEPGHRWMTAFGSFSGDVADLDIEITSGGVFDSGSPMPTQVTDGSMTLSFENCNEGTVDYNIPSIGRSGSVPIERIGLDSVPNCEVSKSGGQSDTESLAPPNSTEVANLCNQSGGTTWEFDWPDVEGANLYIVQAFSPDNPLSPNNTRPDRGFQEFTQNSFLARPLTDRIEDSRRVGWQWRYKPLLGVHKREREWSEVFTFDVRPESDPCLD